jgi:hypothetical protein
MARSAPAAGADVFERTIAAQVDGPDAAVLASLTADAYQRERARQNSDRTGNRRTNWISNGDPLTPPSTAEVTGYRIEAVDPGKPEVMPGLFEVVVGLLVKPSDGVPTDMRLEMRWRNGDWRMLAPARGSWSAVTGPARFAEDYTLFQE